MATGPQDPDARRDILARRGPGHSEAGSSAAIDVTLDPAVAGETNAQAALGELVDQIAALTATVEGFTAGNGIQVFDAGLVTVAELIADGPKLLITPGPGRMVMVDFSDEDAVAVDASAGIAVQAELSNLVHFGHPIAGGWDALSSIQAAVPGQYPAGEPYWYDEDPIYASLYIGGAPLMGAVPDRQNSHAYANGDLIKVNDDGFDVPWIWEVSGDGGTSDDTPPVFDQGASPVTDGEVTWAQAGRCPTIGTAHIILWVATVLPLP